MVRLDTGEVMERDEFEHDVMYNFELLHVSDEAHDSAWDAALRLCLVDLMPQGEDIRIERRIRELQTKVTRTRTGEFINSGSTLNPGPYERYPPGWRADQLKELRHQQRIRAAERLGPSERRKAKPRGPNAIDADIDRLTRARGKVRGTSDQDGQQRLSYDRDIEDLLAERQQHDPAAWHTSHAGQQDEPCDEPYCDKPYREA